jgi:hypothetical protein
MANVSFTPDAPESEITWLTTFNLACLTNFMPCRYLEEIYPASEDWHLYDGTLSGRPGSPNQVNSEQPANSMECRIPVFALGREAAKIISVTSLKESQEQHPDEVDEKATVRFNSLLKGSGQYDPGESIDVISRSYNIRNPVKMQPAPDRPILGQRGSSSYGSRFSASNPPRCWVGSGNRLLKKLPPKRKI